MYTQHSVLRTLPNNFIPIIYNPLFRGHAFARILSSHKECAWDKRWSNNADTEAVNPLDWPESVDFFNHAPKKMEKYGMIFGYNKVESSIHLTVNDPACLKIIASAIKKFSDKLVFISTHPYDESIFYVCKPTIVLWASNMDEINERPFHKSAIPMSPKPDCYNVDVSLFFSTDYETFLSEYIKVISWFDLTPRINAVRSLYFDT